jgi:hypothetical protein
MTIPNLIQLAVLQAVAEHGSGPAPGARQSAVLRVLRADPRWEGPFAGDAGQVRLVETVDALEAGGLLERRLRDGETHLGLTRDATGLKELSEYRLVA